MCSITVFFFKNEKGICPADEWLANMKNKDVDAKFEALIELLEEHGHKLNRPHAAYLRDKIYELRANVKGSNYRLLYFFDKSKNGIITNGFIKKTRKVPDEEIDKAIKSMNEYLSDPENHK